MNIPFRTRTAFHSQPAQHLLIDVGNPMTPDILRYITEVKSNEKSTFQHFMDNLKFAICKILEEYGSKYNVGSTSREKPNSQFVAITIVTLRDGSKIQEYLEEMVKSFSTEKLKRIHILQIIESIQNLTKIGILVDHTQITLNSFKLEQFFKLWLIDCDTSQEHICIHFNNCSNSRKKIVIKCDVVDSVINPFLLPLGHFYQIQTDYFKGSGVIKFPEKHIPVYNLIITKRISGSGVCESLLFGLPQKLSPTKCWQLEGSDSTENQLNFYALCKQLLDQNEYLLAMSTHSQENISMPGHYILIPGEDTLLLRAVASSELVLPNRKIDLLQTNDEFCQNIRDNMNIAFNELPLIEDFTPDTVSSNLYLNLKNNLFKKIEWNEEAAMKNTNVDHPALDSQRTKLCLTKKRRLL